MFDLIRNHRRWMQVILLVLIVPAFAFFGLEGYLGFMSQDKEIAQVDGKGIVLPEFDMARRSQLEELRSRLGSQFDAQAIDTPAFREKLLNELIDQRVIMAAAIDGRYTVSDETLRQTIADVPAVQVDGQFSPERYREILAGQGMTPADFELRLRSDLILAQVLGPIEATAQVPATVLDSLVHALTQQRSVAVRRYAQDAYIQDVEVTDADIEAWYAKNSEWLRLPESVDIDYLVLDEAAATEGVTVTDAQIQSFYEQNQNRYGQPERRRVSHILYQVPENSDVDTRQKARDKAQKALQALKQNPEQFAEIAKAQSEDPGSAAQGGDLGWVSKDTLVPEVEQAVFSLEPDQISEVVESPFGFHVVKVTQTQPASIKPLEQVRGDIENQIRIQLASMRFADLASQLTALVYDQSDSLEPIAQELGLKLASIQGLARDGLISEEILERDTPIEDQVSTVINHPRVRQVAFSEDVLHTGHNSGAIELAPDTIVALRVTKVNPSYVPSLADASKMIRSILTQEQGFEMARAAGEEALKAIQNDPAQASGFGPVQVVSRQNSYDLSPSEIVAIMALPEESVPGVVGVETPDGYALLDVRAIEPNMSVGSSELEQFQRQFSRALGAEEEAAALAILRQKYDAKITPEGYAVIEESQAQ